MDNTYALTESTYYIMLALFRPSHGYGIMQQVEEMSGGRVRLAPGTLYGALTSLTERGWIKPLPVVDGSRKKVYQLTERGKDYMFAVQLGGLDKQKYPYCVQWRA